ncbi:Uncharacterized protein GBIM_08239, partial [Gryllus bimaculatus]
MESEAAINALREERGEAERAALALDPKVRDLSSHNGPGAWTRPAARDTAFWCVGSPNGHSPVLNLSKSGAGGGGGSAGGGGGGGSGSGGEHSGSEAGHTGPEDEDDEDNVSDVDEEDEKDQGELSDAAAELGGLNSVPGSDSQHAINYSTLAGAAAAGGVAGAAAMAAVDPSISSTETLLRNIQGLLKVAADNARQQERQINFEK